MEEEFFDIMIDDDVAIAVGEGVAEEAEMVEAEAEADEEAVQSFKSKALANAKSLGKSFCKGVTLQNVLLLAGAGVMIYDLVEKHADKALQGGKKVKLSNAIDGVRTILVDKNNKTIVEPAKKIKSDKKVWDALSSEQQKMIEGSISMTGNLYWISVGEDIMGKMAEMPIYDPTP